jgi:hypothetical protein
MTKEQQEDFRARMRVFGAQSQAKRRLTENPTSAPRIEVSLSREAAIWKVAGQSALTVCAACGYERWAVFPVDDVDVHARLFRCVDCHSIAIPAKLLRVS